MRSNCFGGWSRSTNESAAFPVRPDGGNCRSAGTWRAIDFLFRLPEAPGNVGKAKRPEVAIPDGGWLIRHAANQVAVDIILRSETIGNSCGSARYDDWDCPAQPPLKRGDPCRDPN